VELMQLKTQRLRESLNASIFVPMLTTLTKISQWKQLSVMLTRLGQGQTFQTLKTRTESKKNIFLMNFVRFSASHRAKGLSLLLIISFFLCFPCDFALKQYTLTPALN